MPTRHPIFTTCLAAMLWLGFAAAPSAAGDRDNSLEVSLGPSTSSSDGMELESVGLRWVHRFDGIWGLQIAYSQEEARPGYLDDDELLEISARLRLFENDRLALSAISAAASCATNGSRIFRRSTPWSSSVTMSSAPCTSASASTSTCPTASTCAPMWSIVDSTASSTRATRRRPTPRWPWATASERADLPHPPASPPTAGRCSPRPAIF